MPFTGDWISIDCNTCGSYRVTGTAYASSFPLPDSERYRMCHWVKQMQLDKRDPPCFDSQSAKLAAASLPTFDPVDKLDILLMSLSKVIGIAGEWHQFDYLREYSLACAANEIELRFYVESLIALERLQLNSGNRNVRLSAEGWQRIAALRETPLVSKKAFVALRFVKDMLDMFASHIKPAVLAAGYDAEISGAPAHNDKIDAHIMMQIKSSRFVIADVTHENNGVYFEAGYAIGLGRPVIWTCNKLHEDKLHFDTRQYNHILWTDAVA
jgi:hypothetical protein